MLFEKFETFDSLRPCSSNKTAPAPARPPISRLLLLFLAFTP